VKSGAALKKDVLKIPVVFFLLLSCAKQAFPPGGPIDKRPPFIIDTAPKRDTTDVPLDSDVEFVFSEPVDRTSCEESIFITPFPGEKVKYRWRGKKLLLRFGEGLLPDRTYVFTIGAGTRDRQNNTMKESFSLAFSTGKTLDEGSIAGNVYTDEGRTDGTQIWAYDLAQLPNPDPARDEPLYITQTGEGGVFKLSYMALGLYRLFSVFDRDKNALYDAEYDFLGVTSRDFSLTTDTLTYTGINFQTAVRDTSPPYVTGGTSPDQNHIDLKFSENMAEEFLSDTTSILIFSQDETLEVKDAFLDNRNSAYLHLTISPLTAGKEYIVEVKRAFDLTGFPIDPDSNRIAVTGTALPDTIKPYFISIEPPDSAQNIPMNSSVSINLSETMDRPSVERGFVLADTLGDTLSGRFAWRNGSRFKYTPDRRLSPETLYFTTLDVDSVFDLQGNSLADTLICKRFLTWNPDTLSAITGTVLDSDTSATGPLHLTVSSTGGNRYELWLEKPGEYLFKDILPGTYFIRAYRDEDENGRYSLGEAAPFVPAERFLILPDSIEVRSRWPNEGNDFFLHQ
jgi:hypothetical protein